jgi:cysteine-rich repeat protein
MIRLAWPALALAGGLAACLPDGAVTCADGSLCPAGGRCDPAGGCLVAEQLRACTDAVDGDRCSYAGVAAGTCRDGACYADRCGDGVLAELELCDQGADNAETPDASCRLDCRPARCGDGVIDPGRGEVCDDGNRDAGDGCAYDCRSDETCGNDVVDVALGEQCEDGNTLAHDGCGARCATEVPVWERVSLVASTADAPAFAAYAVDPGRGELVRFGGNLVADVGRTAVWDGAAWDVRAPAASPPPRIAAAAAYDLHTRRVILFGGVSPVGGTRLGDTWAWDGERWHDLALADAPSPRSGARMVSAPTLGGIVLYGGDDGATSLADTWVFDGERWEEQRGAGPPATQGAGLTYDHARGHVLLVGGQVVEGGLTDAMWRWDGAWTPLAVSPSPAPRFLHGLAYDAVRQRVVLRGGVGSAGALDDMWAWDGTAWTVLPAGPGPAAGDSTALTYDVARDRLVLADDQLGSGWSFDGSSWSQHGMLLFSPQSDVALDERRAAVIGVDHQGTFAWRGSGWVNIAPAPAPARFGAALAYHRARGEVILHGGVAMLGGALTDTWAWDGASWSERTGAVAPTIARGMLVDDPATGDVLGYASTGITWRWDGLAWSDAGVVTPTRPDALLLADPPRARVLLLGGIANGGYALDGYAWDGAAWTALPAQLPANPAAANVGYEPIRQTVMLWTDAATFELGGDDAWRQVFPTSHPQVTDLPLGVFYVGRMQRLVVVPNTQTLWTFSYRFADTPDEACDGISDDDGDGARGCGDADCWGLCDPTCAPGTTCDADRPRCGDATCDPVLETATRCPSDCDPQPPGCGDGVCAPAEDTFTCGADCAICGDLLCATPTETPASCALDC